MTNTGNQDIDISKWWLYSDKGKNMFFFPDGTVLKPGKSISVVSGKNTYGDLFWSDKNMWHDSKDDRAILYDKFAREIDIQ